MKLPTNTTKSPNGALINYRNSNKKVIHLVFDFLFKPMNHYFTRLDSSKKKQ